MEFLPTRRLRQNDGQDGLGLYDLTNAVRTDDSLQLSDAGTVDSRDAVQLWGQGRTQPRTFV